MLLVESKPEHSDIRPYVDRYQYYEMDGPAFFKAIPNGKIECYIVLEGGFEVFDFGANKFVKAKQIGAFPATSGLWLLHIPKKMVCLNIKMNLSALSLKGFADCDIKALNMSINSILPTNHCKQIDSQSFYKNGALDMQYLDNWLRKVFEPEPELPVVKELMSHIDNEMTATGLADAMHMTHKTLERVTKKHFNLTPKELLNIIRFEKTTAHIKSSEEQKLVEALSFGYYDQSHFIKACRKITGKAPGQLFSQMKLPTNDLFFDEEE